MAKPSLQTWKTNTLGHKIDLDNQSYDCVDVSKSWAEFVTGKPWQTSLGWGNAKDIWFNAPAAYWDRVQDPQVGDIVCMSGAIGGGFGHTGVVVEVNGGNITLYQQNTFTQQAVYVGIYSAHASYIQGYLRPKAAFDAGGTPSLAPNQRVVGQGGVYYRQSPNRGAAQMSPTGFWDTGEVLDFKGFVHGESVDGNDIWFVGAYSGGYSHSSGFTDISAHDLTDLTPVQSLQGFQRQIGGDAMNYRKAPLVAPDNVIQVFPAGDILDFKGFVHGQNIDGNDVWFVGKYSGGYVHSSGFVDKGVHDLADLTGTPTTPTPTPDPTPTPTPDPTYSFTKDLDCVTEVIPAGYKSYELGNFPTQPQKVVIHDFGTKGVDTIGSVINTFQLRDNISAHFVVSGKRIVQMVALKDRAYHAGPNGNGFVGIESDPVQDADTKASTKKLCEQLRDKYGYVLEPVKHSSIMPTKCGDDINLADYNVDPVVPTPEPTPTPDPDQPDPVPVPVPPAEAATSAAKFLARLASQAATANVVILGIAALIKQYTNHVFASGTVGWLTVVLTIALIFGAQFGYKVNAKFKWPF